jgi:hypothetical protein
MNTRLSVYLSKAASASAKSAVKASNKKPFNIHGKYLKPQVAALLLAAPATYGLYRLAQDLGEK